MKFNLRYALIAVFLIAIVVLGGFYYAFVYRPSQESAVQEEEALKKWASTLYVARAGPPNNLDPNTARTGINWWDVQEIYECLLTYKGSSTEPQPWLALNWSISEDGTIYTFSLRKDVKFSSGDPFNATAVKFSFDRLLSMKIGATFLVRPLDRVEVADDYTVRFYLNYSWAPFLSCLAHTGTAISNPQFVQSAYSLGYNDTPGQANQYLSTHCDGTGPYMLQEFSPGDRIVLEQNPNYWGGWKDNQVKVIIDRVIQEDATTMMLLGKGDLDIGHLEPAPLFELEKRIKTENLSLYVQKEINGSYEAMSSIDSFFLTLNCKVLPTSDVNVRKALAYSFNYSLYLNAIQRGFAITAKGMIPRGVLGHVEDYPSYDFNLTKAQEYLEKASPEAKAELAQNGLELPYFPGSGILTKDGALMWQKDLATIGIDLKLREIDSGTWYTMRRSAPGVPLLESRWYADYPDPDNFVQYAYTKYWPGDPWFGYGSAFMGNQTMDSWIEEARQETDPVTREALYREIELAAANDWCGLILLCQLHGSLGPHNVRASWVDGYVWNPMSVRGRSVYYDIIKNITTYKSQ